MEATIGEIVKNDYRTADVFKRYDIDFCCGGKKTIAKICNEKHIDQEKLEKELEKIITSQTIIPSHNFNDWELDFLIDYIVNTHHRYVIRENPVLFQYTQKVSKVHGDKHPELVEIASIFMDVMDELNSHMMKEENILFPYIKILAISKKQKKDTQQPAFGNIKNPISMMEHEHDVVGSYFERIKLLSNNYTPPEYACNTYRVCFAKLKEFQDDLFQHIHLENNILFPKAIKLEEQL